MSGTGTDPGHTAGWDDPGIVICTGSGISVASGLPTFRGPGGMYEDNPDLASLSDVTRLADGLDALWAHWGPLRDTIADAEPNAAHRAVADLTTRRADVTVVTMNIDGLHHRAARRVGAPIDTRRLIEIHGTLAKSRCRDRCGHDDWDDTIAHATTPTCPGCGGPARPAVVLFGEHPDPEPQWFAKRAVRGVTTYVAVGTSESVSTGTRLAANARYAGAHMIWVNVEPPPQPDLWHQIVLGPADETLPVLLTTFH